MTDCDAKLMPNIYLLLRNLIVRGLLLFVLLSSAGFASENDPKWSIITASFTHHFYPPGDHTEHFDNLFFAVSRKVDSNPMVDRVVIGTLTNSSNNQCILAGVVKKWKQIDANSSLKGMYAYVGEFLGNTFSRCGRDGIYDDVRGVTGLGFAPYIYHGLEHRITDHVAINGGLILPGVVSFTMELSW